MGLFSLTPVLVMVELDLSYMSTLHDVFCNVADRVELLKLQSFIVGGFLHVKSCAELAGLAI